MPVQEEIYRTHSILDMLRDPRSTGPSQELINQLEQIRNSLQDEYLNTSIIDDQEGFQHMIFNPDEAIKGIQKELHVKQRYKPGPIRTFNFKFRCHDCGKLLNKNQMAIIKDKKYIQICIPCAMKSGRVKCSKCNGYYNRKHVCSCQYKKPSEPCTEVYNYQADWKPFKESNDAYLFGIEIEVELEHNSLSKTDKAFKKPWLIYKWDGSLSDRGNGGFEIVTMPLGWEWMKKNKAEFDVIFDLAKLGLKSKLTDTCGMHVHLNKDIFSTFHLYKFYNFYYKNQKLMHYMSGRTWDNMRKWANFKYGDNKSLAKFSKNKTSGDRHGAINLMNPESVEVRIFRGTLAPDPFWRNIEFVKATCDFTRYAHVNDLSVDLFRDYVRENSKEFPHLYEYLCDKVKGEILCA
jgi:hypothetical protein